MNEYAFNKNDLSPITLALSAKFSRLEAQDDEMGIIQLKSTFPIYKGFSLPIAFTWASRTVDEDEFKFNIGGEVSFDKIVALSNILLGK